MLVNFAFSKFFALNKKFSLFEASHADSSYISIKRTFLLFWVQITLLQDFFHGIKVLACFQLITLILAIFHSKKCFCCCGAKLRCVQLFRTGNAFRLFEAFHIDSNYISLKRKFLLFRRCISAVLHLEPFLCWFPGFTHFFSSLNQNRCSGLFADN